MCRLVMGLPTTCGAVYNEERLLERVLAFRLKREKNLRVLPNFPIPVCTAAYVCRWKLAANVSLSAFLLLYLYGLFFWKG